MNFPNLQTRFPSKKSRSKPCGVKPFFNCPSLSVRAAIEKNRSFAKRKEKILRMDLQQSGKDTNKPSKGTCGHGGLVGRTRVHGGSRVGRRSAVLVWHRGDSRVGVNRGVGGGDGLGGWQRSPVSGRGGGRGTARQDVSATDLSPCRARD